jgi:P-type Cu+ transporter
MERTTVLVSGMQCAGCVSSVERALCEVEGVDEAFVNLATGQAVVSHAPDVNAQLLGEAVRRAGYTYEGVDGAEADAVLEGARRAEEGRLRVRVAVAVALTIPIAVGSMGSMLGLPPGPLGRPSVLLALATPVQFWAGWPFLRGAFAAMRRRSPDMNVLVATGTLAAYAYSALAVANPGFLHRAGAHPEGYFDAVAVIITFLLLGRWLEHRARGRASDAIRSLMTLTPATAHLLREGTETTVPVTDVVVGDLVRVRPGERIAVDGVLTDGASAVDESMLTGESIAVDKSPDDDVAAGTLNASGSFVMRATRVGAETALAQIVRLVREAQGSKAPVQRIADRVVAVFVPVVLAVATLTFAGWLVFGPDPSLNRALLAFVAVLIVACPCAMGLATPVAIMVGTGAGARAGILFRGGEAIERVRSVSTVALDKTGTVTTGEPAVAAVVALRASEPEVLRMAAAVEASSEHPIGRAIVRASPSYPVATAFLAHAGLGAEATVEGVTVLVGRAELMARRGIAVDEDVRAQLDDLAGKGYTTVLVARDGVVAGVLAVADRVKPEAAEAVRRLHALRLRVALISGDDEPVARAVGAEIGADEVLWRVLPDEKAERVRALQQAGESVAMVGDGVNDAPALATADVGIAIGTGTDVAKEASDVTLVSGDVRGVPRAIVLARRTYRTIVQNLFWAFGYNVILIPLAVAGRLSPAWAGVAMAASSVSVVANSLRLRRAPSGPR